MGQALNKPRDADLPPLFRRHVRRPRLTRLLDKTTAQTILIVAPAGYGKTTLAAEWLQGRGQGMWYQVTPASADVAAFAAGVAEALEPIVPGVVNRVAQRVQVPDLPDEMAHALAEVLARETRRWPVRTRLIVDDYHLVEDSPAVEAFMDWLLTLSRIRVLVTARRKPSWVTARRRLHRQVTEITRDDLTLSESEIRAVLADAPDAVTEEVLRQAEGWPVLVGVAATSTRAQAPSDRVAAQLFEYFADEILRREDPAVQRSLIRVSVLPTLDPPSIGALVDGPDPAVLIKHFADQGLVRDLDGHSYSLHPLVREFLRARLHAEGSAAEDDAIGRALEHLTAQQRWDDAFTVALDSARHASAAEIVGLAAPQLLRQGRLETIDKWLAECGPAALTDPSAQLALAELHMRRARFRETAAVAEAVRSRGAGNISRASSLVGQALYWMERRDDASAFLKKHSNEHRSGKTSFAPYGGAISRLLNLISTDPANT